MHPARQLLLHVVPKYEKKLSVITFKHETKCISSGDEVLTFGAAMQYMQSCKT